MMLSFLNIWNYHSKKTEQSVLILRPPLPVDIPHGLWGYRVRQRTNTGWQQQSREISSNLLPSWTMPCNQEPGLCLPCIPHKAWHDRGPATLSLLALTVFHRDPNISLTCKGPSCLQSNISSFLTCLPLWRPSGIWFNISLNPPEN